MTTSSVFATVAGASLLVPGQAQNAALEASAVSPASELLHLAQVGNATFRFGRNEDLSRRNDIRVNSTSVTVYTGHISAPAGSVGYQPRVAFTDIATGRALPHPVFTAVEVCCPSGYFPLSGGSSDCFVEKDRPNITWRPSGSTTSPLVTLTMDRASFDRLLAQTSQGVELTVSVAGFSSCPNSSPAPASDDDGK